MRKLSWLSAWIVLVALVFAGGLTMVDQVNAQIPQYWQNFQGNDFTVLNDSTSDSTFSIGGGGDVDTSVAFETPYRWKGCTLEGLSNSAHADSAGVTIYLRGSLRGVVFTTIDSLLITVDNTPTFKAVDLRAGRYKFMHLTWNGIASTGNAGDDGGPNEPVGFVRIMYWADR